MISTAFTKVLVRSSIVTSLLVAAPGTLVPGGVERAALHSIESVALSQQRAGASESGPLESAERDQLQQLQRGDLEAQRAAGLSNKDLSTILLVLGIVALLIVIF